MIVNHEIRVHADSNESKKTNELKEVAEGKLLILTKIANNEDSSPVKKPRVKIDNIVPPSFPTRSSGRRQSEQVRLQSAM